MDPLELALQAVVGRHVRHWESNLGPAEEQSVLLTAESSSLLTSPSTLKLSQESKYRNLNFKIYLGAGQMQWLGALAAPAEDQRLAVSTHVRWVTTTYNFSSR